jgi:hypothetical protein
MNKTYEELFGPDTDYGKAYPSYEQIVDALGKTVVYERAGDYQGDLFYLIQDGDRYGFVSIGYGSCSGCDAMEACDSKEEVMELAGSIESGVRWFDNKAAARTFFEEHDWAGDWSFYHVQTFLNECWAVLECAGSPPSKRE